MGVYIKGMEMPRSCRQCSLYLQSMDSERNVYENCAVTAKSYNWGLTTRPSDCPLVPVQPHGRLIDADALITEFCEWGTRLERGRKLVITMSEAKQAIVDIIEDAPTIIPAEEVKES